MSHTSNPPRHAAHCVARVGTLLACVLFIVARPTPAASQAPPLDVRAFDRDLEALVRAKHLPGASVAIVKDGRIAWSRGYGFANLATQTPATPSTPYRLASVSKPLAATMLMKLARNAASLWTPRCASSTFMPGLRLTRGRGPTIRIAIARSRSRCATCFESFVDVTPWNLSPAFALPAATDSARRRLLGNRYTPLYSSQTAAGVVSTVEDLARFDIALDAGRIVNAATRELMFTAARDTSGNVLPYGLGWFVEEPEGQKIVWHYGWFPPTVSALYLKIPAQRITMILISNSDALSAGMAWTRMGIRASPYARLFLQHFGKP